MTHFNSKAQKNQEVSGQFLFYLSQLIQVTYVVHTAEGVEHLEREQWAKSQEEGLWSWLG